MKKPSLLLLMAAASGLAVVANGATIASPAEDSGQDAGAPKSRLGTAIQQDMDARDLRAARERRALQLREQAAQAAEARLQAQATAQRQQQEQARAPAGGENAAAEGAQFDDLARIYQAMKPAKAAVVFEQLAMDVQLQVAQRMRERATAQILANMTPAGAAALSMALARGRVEPTQTAQVTRRPGQN